MVARQGAQPQCLEICFLEDLGCDFPQGWGQSAAARVLPAPPWLLPSSRCSISYPVLRVSADPACAHLGVEYQGTRMLDTGCHGVRVSV